VEATKSHKINLKSLKYRNCDIARTCGSWRICSAKCSWNWSPK